VTPLTSSLKTAATQSLSSDAPWSIQPMSPPPVFDASVETAFATSPNALPDLTWARASSAAFFASAIWTAVDVVAPLVICGSTAIRRTWRSSLRVLSLVIASLIC
jgi:hypothetical protein